MHTRIYIHTHVYIHVYACVYVCVCVCVCVQRELGDADMTFQPQIDERRCGERVTVGVGVGAGVCACVCVCSRVWMSYNLIEGCTHILYMGLG